MASPEVFVLARARVQPGRESDTEAALRANAEESRREEGCVSYTVLRGSGDPQLFITVERWRSRSDADLHMKTPHVQKLLGTIGPWLAAPPEILEMTES